MIFRCHWGWICSLFNIYWHFITLFEFAIRQIILGAVCQLQLNSFRVRLFSIYLWIRYYSAEWHKKRWANAIRVQLNVMHSRCIHTKSIAFILFYVFFIPHSIPFNRIQLLWHFNALTKYTRPNPILGYAMSISLQTICGMQFIFYSVVLLAETFLLSSTRV